MGQLGVLESRWSEDDNLTVLPLFDLLRKNRGGYRTRFIYERFSGSGSFDEAFDFYHQRGDISRVYIASHCCTKSFGPEHMGKSGISFDILQGAVCRSNQTIEGVYLATCEFGHKNNLKTLVSSTPALTWAAGYSESVDWEESYALDLLFFRKLLHSKAESEADKIRVVVKHVTELCCGLIKKLGFNVVWRAADGSLKSLS